jgi:PPK2 family polyphosphate:nucleotide phosphotransferase
MIKLSEIDTLCDKGISKDVLKKENKEIAKQISELQTRLVASKKYALLVIYQGMDASGKDGAVKDVFDNINPAGLNVFSFKKPTDIERSHDFLWRVHQLCPPKGMIHIFNRSHYEDILVPTVEGYLPKEIIQSRYQSMNHFEQLLQNEGTVILKFYLHISKERQRERLLERINIREKNYKHNDGDWDTREKWDEYMQVYEAIFERCQVTPWHIIPSDSNTIKVNHISKVILKTLQEMDLTYPKLKSERF